MSQCLSAFIDGVGNSHLFIDIGVIYVDCEITFCLWVHVDIVIGWLTSLDWRQCVIVIDGVC